MEHLISEWYSVLGMLNRAVSAPLGELSSGVGIPVISALLLGLLASTAPCQLSTSAGALAFILRRPGERRATSVSALSFIGGKVAVYTLVGVAIVLLGSGLQQASIPVAMTARKVLGPLMLLIALSLLGVVRPPFRVGEGISERLRRRSEKGGWAGSFLLGMAFSFAVCPTLGLLFFAYLVPLALASQEGLILPGMFALGTTLPLIGVILAALVGTDLIRGWVRGVRRAGRVATVVAGVVLLLAGLNDTLVYWFL